MATALNETLREKIATRFAADYATQAGGAGSILPIQYPNQPVPQNSGNGYVSLSWVKGTSVQTSFKSRREITPVEIFVLVFVARDTGTKTAQTHADYIADALRGQTWTIIANTPAGTVPDRALDGANPVASVITSNLRIHEADVSDIGEDPGGVWYQVNVNAAAELSTKYGSV